ncbi:hypothetical protein [Rubrobacter aplysinae]|uniref:hypothetical protein n=1 Tax=Rubrobacter aplysinae TaxID=909625 RepID=UPI00064BAA3E|nr:hypothetical protein [Rubrobacter aplysinae]
MRGTLFWITSTVLAFAVTAAVFLMLAEVGTSPPERSLSADAGREGGDRQSLGLDLRQETLQGLEEAEDQELGMSLSNGSDRPLTNINVYLILSSEDTAEQNARYYEASISELAANESKRVTFDLDLSSPDASESGGGESGSREQDSFTILEARAASSQGASTVKTAVLSF